MKQTETNELYCQFICLVQSVALCSAAETN